MKNLSKLVLLVTSGRLLSSVPSVTVDNAYVEPNRRFCPCGMPSLFSFCFLLLVLWYPQLYLMSPFIKGFCMRMRSMGACYWWPLFFICTVRFPGVFNLCFPVIIFFGYSCICLPYSKYNKRILIWCKQEKEAYSNITAQTSQSHTTEASVQVSWSIEQIEEKRQKINTVPLSTCPKKHPSSLLACPCEVCGGYMALEWGFYLIHWFSSVIIIPPVLKTCIPFISFQWCIFLGIDSVVKKLFSLECFKVCQYFCDTQLKWCVSFASCFQL